jgi:hypothetical protein
VLLYKLNIFSKHRESHKTKNIEPKAGFSIQPKIHDTFETTLASDSEKKEMTTAIADMVILHSYPFNIVEKQGFKNVIETALKIG